MLNVRVGPCRYLAALLVMAASCTGGGGGTPSPSASVRATRPPTTESPPAEIPSPFVRTCESAVYGQLAPNWMTRSVVVGPLAFAGLKNAARERARDFQRRPGGYDAVKELVVIRTGSTATVSIPRFEWKYVAFLYDPAASPSGNRGRWWLISDGERAVTFRACRQGESPYGSGPTQYNGGFIVDGPRCVALDVRIGDQMPKRVVVSFGTGSPVCPLELERHQT